MPRPMTPAYEQRGVALAGLSLPLFPFLVLTMLSDRVQRAFRGVANGALSR
jgi:hypothetical protein